jgi:riboflavin synthase alpha subunit
LTIADCEDILGDCHLGDSISVNGTLIAMYGEATALIRCRNMFDCHRI